MLSLIFNDLAKTDVDDSLLGLRLQEVVGVDFLTFEVLGDLKDVFVAAKRLRPDFSLFLEILACIGFEVCFKILIVQQQVFLSNPDHFT